MEKRKFNLKTKENCIRLVGIFLVGILVFSFLGKLFQSDFNTVKIEHILLDIRGAQMDGELYYPNGTSSKDKLPAIVIAHGGGLNYGDMRGSASELARRGFVVFNAGAYGSSLSPMPLYDESGNGAEKYSVFAASSGLVDALNYVRSLAFVDSSRVGLLGQSMGSNRAGVAAVQDCGYYSFNDIMINVLYKTFDQKFTSEEISQSADQLAQLRLNADQLKLYNSLRETNWNHFNTRVKSVMVVGLQWLPPLSASANVDVAGYKVVRNLQSNVGYASGSLDVWFNLNTNKDIKSTWFSQQDITLNSWYTLNDADKSSKIVGDLLSSSILNDKDLSKSIQNKTARILYKPVSNVTHTGMFLSTGIYSQQTKFFEQTLGYNRGDLGSSTAKPLDAGGNIAPLREASNCVAMFAMFGMVIALGALLLKTKPFSACVVETHEITRPVFNKRRYWISGAVTVAFTFLSIFITNRFLSNFGFAGKFQNITALPFGQITVIGIAFLVLLTIGTIIVLAVSIYFNKKEAGNTGLNALNIKINFTNVMKSIAVALILLIAAYASLGFIDYFFGQDYRVFTTNFTYMRPEYWFAVIPTAAIYFIMYLIIGIGINYTVRADIPEWKDTLITVVVFSLGVWLACLLNQLLAIFAGATNTFNPNTSFLCNFFNTYHFIIIVPLVVYISRKMYKRTNSIWLGAAVCALLVAWSTVSCGINDVYHGQTWLSNFLG